MSQNSNEEVFQNKKKPKGEIKFKLSLNEEQKDAKQIILDKQKDYKYTVLEMEIMPDHVHLLIDSNPKIGIYNQINKIKG
jgi:putative transposase